MDKWNPPEQTTPGQKNKNNGVTLGLLEIDYLKIL